GGGKPFLGNRPRRRIIQTKNHSRLSREGQLRMGPVWLDPGGGVAVHLPAVEVSQSPESKFLEYLQIRPRPQRYTEQQRDMGQYNFSQHNHFDADQLIDDMKRAGFQVSRATVYRTLNKLVDAGLLRRLDVGPRMFYEHDYGYPQHEHLYCQQ